MSTGAVADAPSLQLPLDFTGRVCIVTGAARGIGRAIAKVFAAHGAMIVIVDREVEAAGQAAEEISAGGGRAQVIQTDLVERSAIMDMLSHVERSWKRIDVVVHNAAFFPLTAFDAIDEATLDRTLAVNLKAAFWLAQGALPAFKKLGKGRLLITSSVTGPKVAYPGLAHYAASKAGVNGFIRAAALELARFGVTVNGVEPGMIATPAMSNLGDASHAAQLTRGIPLGRLGTAEDIAFAMAFLASDAAAYITGQTLVVDGGALLPESGVSFQTIT
jgi:3-oxoacyl-[acyl-carrier protein] reductase